MSSFFKPLVIVRSIILRITSPMPMGPTPGFHLRVKIYMSYMVPLLLGLVLRLSILLTILAIVFEISTVCCPEWVKIRLYSFATRPDVP